MSLLILGTFGCAVETTSPSASLIQKLVRSCCGLGGILSVITNWASVCLRVFMSTAKTVCILATCSWAVSQCGSIFFLKHIYSAHSRLRNRNERGSDMAESRLVVWPRLLRCLLLCRCTVREKCHVSFWHHSRCWRRRNLRYRTGSSYWSVRCW
jgi:hypothetical protein